MVLNHYLKLWICLDICGLNLSCGGDKWEKTDIQNIHLPVLVSRFPCSKGKERGGKGGGRKGEREAMRQ